MFTIAGHHLDHPLVLHSRPDHRLGRHRSHRETGIRHRRRPGKVPKSRRRRRRRNLLS